MLPRSWLGQQVQFDRLKRRDFITLLGGALAVWPLPVWAQQPGKLPKIGFLGSGSASSWSSWNAAFMQRLNELGWVEGRPVAIEMRWAEGRGRVLPLRAVPHRPFASGACRATTE